MHVVVNVLSRDNRHCRLGSVAVDADLLVPELCSLR